MGVKAASMAGIAPFAAMVLSESLDVGTLTLSKAAMSKGLSHFVFAAYSNALATLIIFPPAFFFNRSKRPPITFAILWKIFLLSFVGITVTQNSLYTGINYSSSTLASAMSNLIPGFTFVLAVAFRMEKFELTSLRSEIKVVGTLVSIAGAFIVTFYKGPAIGPPDSNMYMLTSAAASNWILGGLFMVTAGFSLAVYMIFLAAILKEYPSEITVVAFYCLFGTIQCAILTLIAERSNPHAWILTPDIQLLSVIYTALIGNVAIPCMQVWVIHTKGPIFAVIFKPVGVAIAAFLSVILLGETLHVGLISGAIVIITGFYGVIWAQSEDDKGAIHNNNRLPSSSDTIPLLNNLNSA